MSGAYISFKFLPKGITEEIKKYSWREFEKDVKKIVKWLIEEPYPLINHFKTIYGIPKGGLPLAVKLANIFNLKLLVDEEDINDKTLVVDDISDTGNTLERFYYDGRIVITIFYHKDTKVMPYFCLREKKSKWIIFPWEK